MGKHNPVLFQVSHLKNGYDTVYPLFNENYTELLCYLTIVKVLLEKGNPVRFYYKAFILKQFLEILQKAFSDRFKFSLLWVGNLK